MNRRLFALGLLLFVVAPTRADSQPSEAFLSATFRDLLLANLPDPMVTSDRHWGQQKEVVVGLKWHKLKPEPQKSFRNDGHWQRMSVKAIDPSKTLALAVRDVRSPEPGITTFETFLGLDARLTFEQQLWKSGVRVYGGETRARCRAALRLKCEVTSKIEPKPGSILPDVVLRVRVTEAELNYTDLVCEHTAGLDGPMAKAVGEQIHKFVNQVKPSLEKDLLAKANSAIVKAADTRDVRVALDQLLSGKAPKVVRSTTK